MQIICEIKGAYRLGVALVKALYCLETVYHRCSECNLVISLNQKACDRCNALIGWE